MKENFEKQNKNVDHIILRDIEKDYGVPVEGEELKRVLSEIASSTFFDEGFIDVPDEYSPEFEMVLLEDYDTEPLKTKVSQVFSKKGQHPQSIYLLSEEESISKSGLTKIPFRQALDNVIPYIKEWGQMTDYWLSDGDRTITFHRSGVAYWKRNLQVH